MGFKSGEGLGKESQGIKRALVLQETWGFGSQGICKLVEVDEEPSFDDEPSFDWEEE